MSPTATPPRNLWRCPEFRNFRMREWEDEVFLFNPQSGDTHLLNALSIELLRLLRNDAQSPSILVGALVEAFPELDDSVDVDLISAHLQQLEAMGLLVPEEG